MSDKTPCTRHFQVRALSSLWRTGSEGTSGSQPKRDLRLVEHNKRKVSAILKVGGGFKNRIICGIGDILENILMDLVD